MSTSTAASSTAVSAWASTASAVCSGSRSSGSGGGRVASLMPEPYGGGRRGERRPDARSGRLRRVSRPPAPAPPVSLTRRVGSLGRLMVGTVAITALVSGVVLALLFLVLVPATERYADGARSVRLAHLAMLDQQTALRAYLITRDRDFLAPYERGSAAL